jgi:hypothetical protein
MVVTRAKERLHFVGCEPTSELLSVAMDSGLIDVVQAPSIPPVQFTEEDEEPF